jgi:hypothetical protein
MSLLYRGLGTDLRIDCSTGQTIDCDSMGWGGFLGMVPENFLNPTCWGACSASTVAGSTPGTLATAACQQAIGISCPITVVGAIAVLMLFAFLVKK